MAGVVGSQSEIARWISPRGDGNYIYKAFRENIMRDQFLTPDLETKPTDPMEDKLTPYEYLIVITPTGDDEEPYLLTEQVQVILATNARKAEQKAIRAVPEAVDIEHAEVYVRPFVKR